MTVPERLRAFRSARQGLDGQGFYGNSLAGSEDTADSHLSQQGWIRGIGSCTPYFHFWSRAGLSRAKTDQAVSNLEILELPAARACTYIVPRQHFAIALALAQHPADEPKMETGEKKLGFTWEQIESLKSAVLDALAAGPADPRQLKEALGSRVKSYTPEGKKYGITTDLPGAIRRLQLEGKIRRIPIDGRLDNERYAYALWEENPLAGFDLDKPGLQAKIASLYFSWIGPATLDEFTWFTGFSKRDAKAAMESNNLAEWQPGYFGFQTHIDAIGEFEASSQSNPHFLTSLDNLILLTRNLPLHLDEEDKNREMMSDNKPVSGGSLTDLSNHGIFDRGRLIGEWAYDEPNQELVYTAWAGDKELIAKRAADTQAFIQGQLGDARSFSLDSPKSRQARIYWLRQQSN